MTAFTGKTALYLVLATLLLTLGCSKTEENWLIGSWSFDAEKTSGNLPAEATEGMGAMLVQQLMAQAGAGTMTFTATEGPFASTNGQTNTQGYTIQSRPDANTLVIKGEDGEVSTITRTGDHIAIESSGDVQFKAYFKRVR